MPYVMRLPAFAYTLLLLLVLGCESPDAPQDPVDDAQTETERPEEPLHFTANMVPENVVTGSPEATSDAHARASAILHGNTLIVHGQFTNLTSQLRDIEETPDDPGAHIHPGAEGEENSYIYGLGAELNEDERSGIFYGAFELSDGEVALLLDERIYLDIHTVEHDPGEVRDQLRPEDAAAANARARARGIDTAEVTAVDVGAHPCPNGLAECACHDAQTGFSRTASLK